MKYFGKQYGYGLLIKKELDGINSMFSANKKVLGIIGGNKIQDKLPIIESLRQIPNANVFIAGGLARQYKPSFSNEFVMTDGYGAANLDATPEYVPNIMESTLNVYDIGRNSLDKLKGMIAASDTIFWNGTLGLIENDFYRKSSQELLDFLFAQSGKTVIIGGGETASMIQDKKQTKVYVSTGGGALLEFLQNKILTGKTLVGLEIFV